MDSLAEAAVSSEVEEAVCLAADNMYLAANSALDAHTVADKTVGSIAYLMAVIVMVVVAIGLVAMDMTMEAADPIVCSVVTVVVAGRNHTVLVLVAANSGLMEVAAYLSP